MGKFYVGNPIRVNFTIKETSSTGTATVLNITGATVKVYYRNPAGTEANVTGTVVSGTAGTMYGTIPKTATTVAGTYIAWPSVILNGDTEEYEGEPIEIVVYEIGY